MYIHGYWLLYRAKIANIGSSGDMVSENKLFCRYWYVCSVFTVLNIVYTQRYTLSNPFLDGFLYCWITCAHSWCGTCAMLGRQWGFADIVVSIHITARIQCVDSFIAVNSLRPRLNRRPFADDIFKCIFSNENQWIMPRISLQFVPKVPINNIPALFQIMAWRRSGDKPLSEPMMVNLLTHICVTRPQWACV